LVPNELNRSAGLDDAYPLVLNSVVRQKLTFVEKTIDFMKVERAALAG
jgi:hypothetical protein